ncbi:MAG: hypothetical protein ACKOCK_12170, partial [Chloroflexota bacterium]
MQQRPQAASTAPLGVFASFAAGFSLLLTAPLPILVPVVTDAFLLTGPRIAPTSLAAPIADAVAKAPNAGPAITEVVRTWAAEGTHIAIICGYVPSLVSGLDAVGKCDKDDHGTTTSFLADTKIFTGGHDYNSDTLAEWFRQTPYLTRGLKLTLIDERIDRELTFWFE